jgi:hypothetical protein
MTMKCQKDKKLADIMESVVATVSMVGGLHAGYSYLRNLEIVRTDLMEL